MPGVLANPTVASADSSRRALDFVHRLLSLPASEAPALDGLLAELAGAFAASGAGLAQLADGVPLQRFPPASEAVEEEQPLPWQGDPGLLERVGREPASLTVSRPGGGSFLLTAVRGFRPDGWLLWLEDTTRETWDGAEGAALALAGQALARRLGAEGDGPRWASQMNRLARQQRLEEAASLTRRLAHDFGNVLTGILGFSELALTEVPTNTPLHNHLNEVHRGAQGGAQLTNLLRLFARRGGTPAGRCAPAAVLTAEEARLRPNLGPVDLQVRVPAELPAVAMDAEPLRQVLGALLDNAREALTGPGSVTVSARAVRLDAADCLDLFGNPQPGEHVEIEVADTGAGLSPEAWRRLFAEPFFTTKPRRRGFGLAIAYGILNSHRSGLLLRPGAERGTVARFVIPVAGALAAATPHESSAGPVQGEKVLVVDDDPMILQLVCTTLKRAGYRVQAATGGEEALQSYSAAPESFSLVLSDVIMPQVNGVELARRLLSRDAGVRVLFMSGQVSADFARQDAATGHFELLPKPFRAEGLLRAVRTAIDRAPDRPLLQRSTG